MAPQMPLTVRDIAAILPQRYPMAMLDRVIEINDECTVCKAFKNFAANEPFFAGHFPNNPVVPGVLLIEAMAQTCALMLTLRIPQEQRNDGKTYFFAGIDKARFKKVVLPGDRFVIEAKLVRERMGIVQCDVTGYVDDQVVCSALLTSARQ